MDYKPIFDSLPGWVTRFQIDGGEYGGSRDPADDYRLGMLDRLVQLKDLRVLELGPLEGAHTVELERLGAREIVSIEGRPENFIKCSVIAQLHGLSRSRFQLGDLREIDLNSFGRFDLCVALGVLYHFADPFELLERIAEVAPKLFLWTCYSDGDYPASAPVEVQSTPRNGRGPLAFKGKYYREMVTDPQAGFQRDSFWPFDTELLRMIKAAGYRNAEILDRGVVYDQTRACTVYATSD